MAPGVTVSTIRRIDLRNGMYAIVDESDYLRIAGYSWRARKCRHIWYAIRHWNGPMRNGKRTHHSRCLHLDITKAPPGYQIDHENGNGLDCRRSNLRIATPGQNQMNSRSRGGSSDYKGVAWHKTHCKWRASIQLNHGWKHLGYFESEQDAAHAYNIAAEQLFAEFANINKIKR